MTSLDLKLGWDARRIEEEAIVGRMKRRSSRSNFSGERVVQIDEEEDRKELSAHFLYFEVCGGLRRNVCGEFRRKFVTLAITAGDRRA